MDKRTEQKESPGMIFGVSWVQIILAFAAFIIISGLIDDKESAETAIVLGTGDLADAELSRALSNRCVAALELYQQGRVSTLYLSGTVEDSVSEPEKMRGFLLRNGVDSNAIIMDTNGASTYDSALSYVSRQSEGSLSNILIVTHYYHVTRCKLAFRKAGVEKAYAVHPRAGVRLKHFYLIPREMAAIIYYLFRDYSVSEWSSNSEESQ